MTQPAVRSLPSLRRPAMVDPPIAHAEDAALRVYTIAEAAKLLRVPDGWLRKKVTAGLVPHTRLGKHVRFTDEHLDQIIRSGEQSIVVSVSPSGVSRRARRATS
jgi:excisionase family DNA binding protein